jgi:serine/threonine protein kinase, bacterial
VADVRGAIVIAAALISAAATVIAALITQSSGESTTPPSALQTAPGPQAAPESQAVPETLPTRILTKPAEPGFPTPVQAISPTPALPGDLGVSLPMTRPACDGRFVVFTGAAVHPTAYRARVQDLLDTYPGSQYLRASDTCPSLRARDGAGNEIYGVYFGPFATQEQACNVRGLWAEDSYVKVLDTFTDPGVIIKC